MTVLGIDLGTTNSAMAVIGRHGSPEMVANREGQYVTPSVVFFDGDLPIVGASAKRSAALDPESVVQFVKRHMGEAGWSFSTSSGQSYSAEEVSALILRRMREDAETILGEAVAQAVISVPAYFGDAQRSATKDAGALAGLEVLRIVNEPTAAALAYGVEAAEEGTVVVYDLGGGTFDVTVLDVAPSKLEVRATGGDRNLGGLDFDNAIMNWLTEAFMAEGGEDLTDDPRAEADLRDKAEAAKMTLSSANQAKVVLSAGGRHQTVTLDRATFQSLTGHLLERTQVILEEVVENAGLRWGEVDKVLLVGGSTRMAAVAALVESVTGKKPSRELHPDEVVAMGAAIQGGLLAAQAGAAAGRFLPGAGSAGAAGIDLVEVAITDVTAHGMGIAMLNSTRTGLVNEMILDRDSSLPCEVEIIRGTSVEGQATWTARITQGESENLDDVTVVGEGMIAFPPRPAGHPMSIRFSYDLDGIIHVKLFDGQSAQFYGELNIARESNLSPDELVQKRERLLTLPVE